MSLHIGGKTLSTITNNKRIDIPDRGVSIDL